MTVSIYVTGGQPSLDLDFAGQSYRQGPALGYQTTGWKTARDIHVYDGGSWKKSQSVHIRNGGTWKQMHVAEVPSLGDAFFGGYYAGLYNFGGAYYYALIVAPKANQVNVSNYQLYPSYMAYGTSNYDGLYNSFAADSAGHMGNIAASAFNSVIGGYDDWYLPSLYELEVIYYNLKPTNQNNDTSSSTGNNFYSVPRRSGQYYTTSSPAQTSLSAFQIGGSQAFDLDTDTSGQIQSIYATSTNLGYGSTQVYGIHFMADTSPSVSPGKQVTVAMTGVDLVYRPIRKMQVYVP
jgi:hypothetical protein